MERHCFRQIKADNALLRELKATAKMLIQVAKNAILTLAEGTAEKQYDDFQISTLAHWRRQVGNQQILENVS